MPVIHLQTVIQAPVERCFLLSLSVDLHLLSTKETNEKAVAGITSGVMNLNDTVTWKAKHFGVYQHLTSKITAYQAPDYFISEMVDGAFKKLHHRHSFEYRDGKTTMTDLFDFEAPLGIFGNLFSVLILKNYLKGFLIKRNETIKETAEGNTWKKILAAN